MDYEHNYIKYINYNRIQQISCWVFIFNPKISDFMDNKQKGDDDKWKEFNLKKRKSWTQ
jgi:hypothetical protein